MKKFSHVTPVLLKKAQEATSIKKSFKNFKGNICFSFKVFYSDYKNFPFVSYLDTKMIDFLLSSYLDTKMIQLPFSSYLDVKVIN